jgi:hypothetical protein
MTETPAAAQAIVVHSEEVCEHVEHFWDLIKCICRPELRG